MNRKFALYLMVMAAFMMAQSALASDLNIFKNSSKSNPVSGMVNAVLGANSEKVFDDNKENLKKSYMFFRDFNRYADRNDSRAYDMAPKVQEMIDLAQNTVTALKDGIKEGLQPFERKNKEAHNMSLAAKVRYVEGYLRDVGPALGNLKKGLLREANRYIDKINSTKSNKAAQQNADIASEKIAVLETFAKDDADVADAKQRLRSAAKGRAKLVEKQIAGKRMPAEAYSGRDIKQIKEDITVLCEKKFNDDVVRVVIASPDWVPRKEKVYKNGKIVYYEYKAIKAFIAMKEGSRYMVREINFRKDPGRPLDFMGFAGQFEIKKENINS